MIDIEDDVFQLIYTAVKTEYPDAEVLAQENLNPKKFPCVTVEEVSNYPLHMSQDTASYEHHVNVIYEINVYANKATGRKSQCKDIFKICDDVFARLFFVRTMKAPAYLEDTTIYRLVGRYSAIVGENKTIYRRK